MISGLAMPLDEQRAAVFEEYVDNELRRGRHADVLGQLVDEISRSPLREGLRAQLMVALFRSGRQAEALQTYRQARRVSIEELGLEPGEQLRRVEAAILAGDPALTRPDAGAAREADPEPAGPALPRHLPAPIADFTGRTEEVRALRRALAPDGGPTPAVPTTIVSGPGGVGKSALAVHVAHLVADAYPDGQLYAVLNGMTRPEPPTHVLERFLRALGVAAAAMPEELEERAALYRGLLADRRVLVVLDDIGSGAQVEPLLPPRGGCAVLMTTQKRITELPGAHLVELAMFTPRTALALLERIIGADRTHEEGPAARKLVELCGHLPLAVRIAGSRLAARPDWSVHDIVERIEESGRLDELGVRASLEIAYDSLEPAARRLLRRIAVVDATDIGAWVSPALLDTTARAGQDALGELVRTHLVEVDVRGGGGSALVRYRLHGLVRLFAGERAVSEEPTTERTAALHRFFGAFLHLVDAAHRREYGGDYQVVHGSAKRFPLDERLTHRLVGNPVPWLATERGAIVATVEQAAGADRADVAWSLATGAVTLFEARAHVDDWRETHRVAMVAVRAAGDRLGEAALLNSTGALHLFANHLTEAQDAFDTAARMFDELGEEQGYGMALRGTAFVDRVRGDIDRARRRYDEALAVFRRISDHIGEAYVLNALAQLDVDLGRDEEAVVTLKSAAQICAWVGNRRIAAQIAHRLGDIHVRHQRLDAAHAAYAQVRAFAEDSHDPVAHVFWMAGEGYVALRREEYDAARELLGAARRLAVEVSQHRMQARASLGLATLALATGELDVADTEVRTALAISHELGNPLDIAEAELHLGEAQLAAGDPRTAAVTYAAALGRLRASPFRAAGDLHERLVGRLAQLGVDDDGGGGEPPPPSRDV